MKLADYLKANDVSIGAFAAQIGVSHETVRRYVKGDRRPEWEIVDKIHRVTEGKVTANDFSEVTAA